MCGIFGHITLKEKKKFNFPMFCTLGIDNDSRGGDSCGIFIDGQSEYGTTTATKYFSDFFLGSKLLSETKTFNIALGHCRKASPGMGIAPEKAQPVILRNAKTGEARFVMIHNGTIHNYEELAKKYIPNVDIKGLTDSQVMARIFFYKGYDCLAEYRGGSVFFIVDYRQPEPLVLMFKGASKKYDTANSIVSEERPLFISQGKDDLVFSSLDDFLPAFRPSLEVQTIKENCLIKYSGGKLTIVETYDRKEMCQAKPTVTTYYGGNFYGSEYSGRSTSGSSSTSIGYESVYSFYESKENLYTAKGTPIHGMRHMEKYGRCNSSSTASTKDIWFFHGVALKDKDCFKLLEDYQKKTKQTPEDFFKKHQNLIRFLSVDRLYSKNGALVLATGIYTYQVYTGIMNSLFDNYDYHYDKGQFITKIYKYDSTKEDFYLLKGKTLFDIPKLRKKLCL